MLSLQSPDLPDRRVGRRARLARGEQARRWVRSGPGPDGVVEAGSRPQERMPLVVGAGGGVVMVGESSGTTRG